MTDDKQEHINWFPHILVIGSIAIVAILILSMSKSAYKPQKKGVWENRTPVATFTRIDNPKYKSEKIQLPHSMLLNQKEKVAYKITLKHKAKDPTIFRIIPDDCVEKFVINGKELKLKEMKEIDQKGLCSWTNGFFIDLKEHIKVGDNTVDITVLNNAGPGGLRIQTKQ